LASRGNGGWSKRVSVIFRFFSVHPERRPARPKSKGASRFDFARNASYAQRERFLLARLCR
jgi:hypothetical protein